MEPSKKAKPIQDVLESMVSRMAAIKDDRCIDAPIGCGRKINFEKESWSRVDVKEYVISGLCLQCQKRIFE